MDFNSVTVITWPQLFQKSKIVGDSHNIIIPKANCITKLQDNLLETIMKTEVINVQQYSQLFFSIHHH